MVTGRTYNQPTVVLQGIGDPGGITEISRGLRPQADTPGSAHETWERSRNSVPHLQQAHGQVIANRSPLSPVLRGEGTGVRGIDRECHVDRERRVQLR